MSKFINSLGLTRVIRKSVPSGLRACVAEDYNCAGGWGECGNCGDDCQTDCNCVCSTDCSSDE